MLRVIANDAFRNNEAGNSAQEVPGAQRPSSKNCSLGDSTLVSQLCGLLHDCGQQPTSRHFHDELVTRGDVRVSWLLKRMDLVTGNSMQESAGQAQNEVKTATKCCERGNNMRLPWCISPTLRGSWLCACCERIGTAELTMRGTMWRDLNVPVLMMRLKGR